MARKRRSRRRRKLTQLEILRRVMLSAANCGAGWLTLEELAELTLYGEASISAQLRHLLKPRYGSYILQKRPRFRKRSALRALGHGPLREYRLGTEKPSAGACPRKGFGRSAKGRNAREHSTKWRSHGEQG